MSQPSCAYLCAVLVQAETDLARTIGGNMGVSKMESAPNDYLAFYDTPGLPPQPGYEYLVSGVQAIMRGGPNKYLETYLAASAIQEFLHDRTNVTLSGVRLIAILAQGEPIHGQDDNSRDQFSMNFLVHRTSA